MTRHGGDMVAKEYERGKREQKRTLGSHIACPMHLGEHVHAGPCLGGHRDVNARMYTCNCVRRRLAHCSRHQGASLGPVILLNSTFSYFEQEITAD